MLHRFFAITCLIVISTRSFVTSNNVTGASTKPSTTSPTTTLTTTVIIQTSSTTRQTATTKTANTTIQTNTTTTTTTTVAPKIKDKVSGASIIQSSEEPDFEDALKSDEQRTGYYKFVKKGNDSDVVISSRVNLKKKKIEISDIDKRYATFSVTATNYQDANKQLITFMSKLLNVKEDQVSIKSGISSNEKILKITDYKRSRYRVLYKMVQAWEGSRIFLLLFFSLISLLLAYRLFKYIFSH
ncbi:uncharacterized protein LOC142321084 isoform X2 [Lycorma delicatula]|uniref:uncharacterized protein LOC142321084 isoform X2 n=1 Tax=Lycorma delicatula TaxID=130591 RepID=UPI003F51966A